MEVDDQKEQPSEEDIPSDFFDDFNKDEFIQGLSVIDSWDDEDPSARKTKARTRIDEEAVDSVNDLRELIDAKDLPNDSKNMDSTIDLSHENRDDQRSRSSSRLDSYIQPGSRRDPTKTSQAIMRDKEVKVKEYLAKHLESGDELKPPGTELDDFFDTRKNAQANMRKNIEAPVEKEKPLKTTRDWDLHNSPRKSPRRKQQYEWRSPRRSPRWSPVRRSPVWRSPARRSPVRRSPLRRSPYRRSPYRRSPHRRSPQRRLSPRRRYSPLKRNYRLNRFSPNRNDRDRHYSLRHSGSSSFTRASDDFLYPKEFSQPNYDSVLTSDSYVSNPQPSYAVPGVGDYPVSSPDFLYTQSQVYSGYPVNYEYTAQPPSTTMVPIPQPVPAPNVVPNMNINPAPPMVPPPPVKTQAVQPSGQTLHVAISTPSSIDPLAKLVAEGKLSHEDYLKLAPNKGSASSGDIQSKIAVLKRCNEAISQLDKLALPTRLLINNSVVGAEQSRLAPKFCSPLKRQVTVEFHFTKTSSTATTQQNKQIIDNIIASIGLEKILDRSKKKSLKNLKETAVQTTKPICDVCEIRSATKYVSVGTSTEPEYFTSTVHTQVVEQDLLSSKYVFNPTGSATNNPPISIAHLTPAQLVSQLAARAKTLKQPEDPGQQYNRHNSPGFEARGQQGRQYHENYSTFRY